MGWLWSSSSSPAPKADAPSSPAAAAPASSTPPTTSTSSSSSSSPDDTSSYDDPELRKFVDLFQSTATPATAAGPAPTPEPNQTPESPHAPTTTASPPNSPPLRERSLADALLPSSMSCRQAFDLAWACQSPAGQWRAVYRHGSVQPCSQLWDDFWFCMRVRGGGPGGSQDNPDNTDSRARAVREHYRTREIEKYYAPGRPSSEDVWRSRTRDEVLPPDAVFQHAFHVAGDARAQNAHNDAAPPATDPSRKDADEIVADMERRRKIRQQMGYSS